jgi:RNA polymerase sigma-70 factor (ECF subfamily)
MRAVTAPDPDTDDLATVARTRHDPSAFGDLYATYYPVVFGYCRRKLGNDEMAADVTSQVFLRAMEALPRVRPDPTRPGSTFRSWLFTIAHNCVVDAVRRSHRHGLTSLESPGADGFSIAESIRAADPAETPEALAIASDLHRQVSGMLNALTPRQRQIVELRLAGLTGSEIAETLGISRSAVKSSQFRAYEALRTLLDESNAPYMRPTRKG